MNREAEHDKSNKSSKSKVPKLSLYKKSFTKALPINNPFKKYNIGNIKTIKRIEKWALFFLAKTE